MGMVPAPIPFQMTDRLLMRRIAEAAEDSSRVILTDHAKKRMRKRRVLLPQVLHVLKHGTIAEPAHQDVRGNWKCTLQGLFAGDRIKVSAVLLEENGTQVLVITVMN